MRGVWLRVHRYAGLLLAVFLLMAGLTGSLLAWNAELDEALNPQFFDAHPSAASTTMLVFVTEHRLGF